MLKLDICMGRCRFTLLAACFHWLRFLLLTPVVSFTNLYFKFPPLNQRGRVSRKVCDYPAVFPLLVNTDSDE